MEIDFSEYRLRCELRGHDDDVRGICLCGDGSIATSSRDRTVRVWEVSPADKRKYEVAKVLLGHTSFVGPLAYISPNEKFPEGGIVSGGMDTTLILWDLKSGERAETLKGHQMQVTGIALDNDDIVSCSIDCSLRRWRNGKSVEVWDAHKAPVQAVVRLQSGELVTGSSDTTIKLWKDRTCTLTLSGHKDTVRGLAPMHGLGILSASHDGCIRLWAISGEVLMEMVGHSSIVYSVDSHVSGLIVSGSEDRFVKVWKDGVCVQSIEHPGCIWDVKFLEDGDIVTACSDGVIRIWTTQNDKTADSVELDLFASELSSYKRSRKKVGGLKLEELPGIEALHVPGSSDGQTKVIREGDNGVAYAWNSSEMKWDKIGEVVDGPDDDMKRPILDGVQYDYVFDVDIGDGEPVRKLPYNRSDNPYDTADKWLLKENLPLSYRQQVVEFILANTGQSNFIPDSSFRDPFTGANAYVPGESSFMAAKPAIPSFKHIPKKGMLVFDAAQFDGILRKVLEFNSTLLSDQHKTNVSLSNVEIVRLEALVKTLKDTSHYHSSKVADADINLLLRLLESWPDETIFPVFDLLRMAVLHPDGAAELSKHINSSDIFISILKKATRNSSAMANFLTSTRAVVNLFKNSAFVGFLQQHRSEILDAYSSCCSTTNKNLQLSYSTLLLNYSVLLIEKKDQEGQSQVLSAALEVAEEESLEVDARFRALVAIGSLMLDGSVRQIALDFDVASIAAAARTSKEPKIVEIGADIEALIKRD